jgi:tetratricopeptide (TPR) repeat protein
MDFSSSIASWFKFEPLAPKDAVTLILTVLSIGFSVYLYRDKRRKDREDAKKDYAAALASLLDARKELAEVEFKAAEAEKLDPSTRAMISQLANKREAYLSRLIYLIKQFKLEVSAHEFIVLGATLRALGRIDEALDYSRRAMDVASNTYESANAERFYGETLIESERAVEGRAHMLAAAKLFRSLPTNSISARSQINFQIADTYCRLISVSLRQSEYECAQDDFKAADAALKDMQENAIKLKERVERDIRGLREDWLSRRQL